MTNFPEIYLEKFEENHKTRDKKKISEEKGAQMSISTDSHLHEYEISRGSYQNSATDHHVY